MAVVGGVASFGVQVGGMENTQHGSIGFTDPRRAEKRFSPTLLIAKDRL